MNPKTLATGIVATVIMIVLASAVLLPVVSEAQKVAGTQITYSNEEGNNRAEYALLTTHDEFELNFNFSAKSMTTPSETISGLTQSQIVFASESAYIWWGGGAANFIYVDATHDTQLSMDSTVTYSDGTVHIIWNSSEITLQSEWAIFSNSNGEYVTTGGTDSRYIAMDSDYICSGNYTSGENDTYYSYYGGVLKCGDYEGTITIDKELVEGTTDIYKTSGIKIGVGDEEFSPFLCLVKAEVVGHEDSGATYSLIGLIPILVFAGLVVGVIGMFVARRD